MFDYLCDLRKQGVAKFCEDGSGLYFMARIYEAIREAMLVGLPCLLSDIEGHRNLARDTVDALFFKDKESLSHKLTMLITNGSLRRRLAKNGCSRVESDLVRRGEIDEYLGLLFTALTQNQ
jgi:glycosyltransferase involved in cell wall biosynthesis